MKLLTTKEAADALGVCVETVRRHLLRGQLDGVKVGPRLWRIPESALREYVKDEGAGDEDAAA